MAGLTIPLSYPFYTGAAVAAADVPFRLPISIADHAYLIEVPEYRRSVVEQLRPPTDQGSEPGEQSFNTMGLWKRSQSDFSLGAGQDFFDAEESSRRRFRSSLGVNPWTKHQLTLLNGTEAKAGGPTTNATQILAVGTRLYVAGGSDLFYTADPDAAAPTWATIAVGSPVLDFTTDGTYVYIATAAGMYRVTIGSTVLGAVWSAGSFTHVEYANGRLLATTATVLSEISSSGTASTVKTLTFTGFAWAGISSSPSASYAWANSSSETEVYSVGVDETTGALAVPVFAGALPRGERLLCMEFYGGVMILGTTLGLRLAMISGDSSLSYGPAIECGAVYDLDQRGQYCWFTWSDYDATHTGLGRADLAHWTEEMVPAYATDLMALTTGTVRGVAWLSDRHYFTVESVGLYGQIDDLVTQGEFYSGWIRYGNLERKILSSIDVRTLPLVGSIEMHVHMENDTHIDVAAHDDAGTLSPVSPRTISEASGEANEVHLELLRDATDATTGPTLRYWTLRALPAPTVIEEILLPIVMADEVVNDRGIVSAYNPLAEYQYLVGLVESKEAVRYQEGTASYRVYVSKVEVIPQEWSDNARFFNGILAVRLVTISSSS